MSPQRARLRYVLSASFWRGVSKVIIKRKQKPAGMPDVLGKNAILSVFSTTGYLYGRLLKLLGRINVVD